MSEQRNPQQQHIDASLQYKYFSFKSSAKCTTWLYTWNV